MQIGHAFSRLFKDFRRKPVVVPDHLEDLLAQQKIADMIEDYEKLEIRHARALFLVSIRGDGGVYVDGTGDTTLAEALGSICIAEDFVWEQFSGER